jgi:hypothetical protein
LNEAYERALCSIEDAYAKDTLKVLLNWLLYSSRPLRLEELAEVVAIDTSNKPHLKTSRRLKQPKEIFDLCTCLVTLDTEPRLTGEELRDRMFALDEGTCSDGDESILHDKSILRLAHSSVIEYLTGDDIIKGPACEFKLDEARAHPLLAEASLAYIVNFDLSHLKLKSEEAQREFPLLGYAIDYWFDHASFPMLDNERNKVDTLISEALKTRWETYRHLTYLPKVPKYDTWPSPVPNTWEQEGGQSNLCNVCKSITLEQLRDTDGFFHRTYEKLEQFRMSCRLCLLIHAALTHFAAMKSLQRRTRNYDIEDTFTNDINFQGAEIARTCGSQRVRLIVEAQDPFLLVQLSCYFGCLHLFPNPGKERISICCWFQLTLPGGEASKSILGRPINMNPNCGTTFQQITKWFNDCQTTHTACTSGSGSAPQFLIPTRLIQVEGETSQLRLVEMVDSLQKVIYATLTHRLGIETSAIMTKAENLLLYQNRIIFNYLPKTFRDAIIITRAIGISYLWIDALCIIQDSLEDRQRESSNLTEYYNNGALNLVAGAKDSTSGLFESRWVQNFKP